MENVSMREYEGQFHQAARMHSHSTACIRIQQGSHFWETCSTAAYCIVCTVLMIWPTTRLCAASLFFPMQTNPHSTLKRHHSTAEYRVDEE